MSWANMVKKTENKYKASFYVPKTWHNTLRGNNGCNIKSAQKKYHCKIILPKIESNECGICVIPNKSGNNDVIGWIMIYFDKICGFGNPNNNDIGHVCRLYIYIYYVSILTRNIMHFFAF